MKRILGLILLAAILTATMLLCASCKSKDDVAPAPEATAHTHNLAEAVVENVVNGGCLTNSSYELVHYCTDCHLPVTTTLITTRVAHGAHTPAPAVEETRLATCTTPGGVYSVVYCSDPDCLAEISATLVTQTEPALDHAPGTPEDLYEAPTCTTDGKHFLVTKCSRANCDEELDRVFIEKTSDPLGHIEAASASSYEQPLTCYQPYVLIYYLYCERCESRYWENEIERDDNLLPHAYGEPTYENVVAATCTVDGSMDVVRTCTVAECQHREVTPTVITAQHTPGTPYFEVITPATCTTPGVGNEVTKCTVCNQETNRVLDVEIPASHTEYEEMINYVEPTCAAPGGYTLVKKCSVCNDVLDPGSPVVIPALGHREMSFIYPDKVDPTCTTTGSYTRVKICIVCNEQLSAPEFVVVDSYHTTGQYFVTTTVTVPADCVNDGSITRTTTCTHCNTVMDVDVQVIDALGHDHSSTLTENYRNGVPTDGCYDLVVYCLRPGCGVECSRRTVDHTPLPMVYENVVAVGCNNDGTHEEVVYCSTCNQEAVDRVFVTDAIGGHIYIDRCCYRCGLYAYSNGLEFTLSADGTYYIVTGIGTCTDDYLIIPRTYRGLPVAEIDRWAFYDCDSITRLLILKEMKKIPDMAFYGCDNLFRIIVEQDNPNYSSADGNLYNKQETKLIQYAIGKLSTTFTIPDGVTEIGYGAFACNKNLETVIFASSVTTINESAFAYCNGLKSVELSGNITTIREGAFAYCHNLESVVIGAKVNSIEKNAFVSCTMLTSVTFANTSGWKVAQTANGRTTSVSNLGNRATAATLLTTTYSGYYWTK